MTVGKNQQQQQQTQMDRLRVLVARIKSPTFTAYDVEEGGKQVHVYTRLARLEKNGEILRVASAPSKHGKNARPTAVYKVIRLHGAEEADPFAGWRDVTPELFMEFSGPPGRIHRVAH